MFALVLMRLAGIVRSNEEATQREAALRLAGETLVSATTREEIYEAALQAAARGRRPARAAPACTCAEDGTRRAARRSARRRAARSRPAAIAARRCSPTSSQPRRAASGWSARARRPEVCLAPLFVRERSAGRPGRASPSARSTARPGEPRDARQRGRARAAEHRADRGERRTSAPRRGSSSLIKNSSDVICVVDEDGGDPATSARRSRQTFGYDPDGAARAPARRARPPGRRARALQAFVASVGGSAAGQPESRRVPRAPRRRALARRGSARHEPARRRGDRGHRAEHPRHQRAQGLRGRARAPGLPRRRSRACPTARCSATASGTRWPPSAASACPWRCCSWTSTTSRTSTTASATPPATRSCRRSAAAWRTACARSTPRPASAATSSRS